MLKSLTIKNYALIDQLQLRFESGFTAITGETGAGKSILLGALALLLGKRADMGALRNKDEKCVVEGVFDLVKLQLSGFFLDNDIDYSELTILRREIVPSGRSRAFINDTPVMLDLLRDLGDKLVDIHSQHQTQMLAKTQFQLNVLDGYCAKPEVILNFTTEFESLRALKSRLENLTLENTQAKREEDYIRFQLNELDAVQLDEELIGTLVEREKFLVHAEDVVTEIANANRLLSEDDETIGDKLNLLQHGLGKIVPYLSGIDELERRIRELLIEIRDIESEISRLGGELEFDPNELQSINNKLNELYKLQQKHAVKSVTDLIEIRESYRKKLAQIVSCEDEIEDLTKIILQKEALAMKWAQQLSAIRKEHAASMGSSIVEVLQQLGMKNAGFKVVVEKQDELNPHGLDKVYFLFDANKKKDLGHISKVASGGELSRLMLAIKSLIGQGDFLPTIIFDEIDSGVSGEVAGRVGSIIKKMSTSHQVIAITHLPQIAAKADQHLQVVKISEEEISQTTIRVLDDEGRVNEIAKLLSDERVSESAKNTAKELLYNN